MWPFNKKKTNSPKYSDTYQRSYCYKGYTLNIKVYLYGSQVFMEGTTDAGPKIFKTDGTIINSEAIVRDLSYIYSDFIYYVDNIPQSSDPKVKLGQELQKISSLWQSV